MIVHDTDAFGALYSTFYDIASEKFGGDAFYV